MLKHPRSNLVNPNLKLSRLHPHPTSPHPVQEPVHPMSIRTLSSLVHHKTSSLMSVMILYPGNTTSYLLLFRSVRTLLESASGCANDQILNGRFLEDVLLQTDPTWALMQRTLPHPDLELELEMDLQ